MISKHSAWHSASRRRFLVWGGFGAAALCLSPVLSGCSGGTKHGPDDSVYAGSYRAAYTIPTANENGTFSYSVAQKGDMIGSFVDSSTNTTRAFSGRVDNNGTFSGTTVDGSLSYPTSGTISKVVSSSTGGDFRQMRSGTPFAGSFSFLTTGVTAPSDSPYAGAYNGSFNLTGETAGPASYSVDKQGGVTGFVTTNNETGTLTGQVSNTGSFVGRIDYPSGQALVTGALAVPTTPGIPAGNIVQTKGTTTTPGTFGGPVALPADSPYAGAYSGSFNLANQGAGPASYSVDKKGNITGFVTTNGETGTLTGQVSNEGAFTGTIAYASGQATVGGALATSTTGQTAGNFTQTKGGATVPGNFGGPVPLPSDSPFTGAYSGSFNLAGQTAGPASYAVDKKGGITGSVTSNGETGILSGQVSDSGAFTGTITYPSGQATVGGTLATTSNGQPSGNFTQTKGTVSTPGSFGGPIPLPANSPFLGSYQGTYGVPDSNEAGDLSFTIDPSGKIIGSFNGNNNDPAGDFDGTVGSDGSFRGTITYLAATNPANFPTRIITGKMAGSDRLQGDFRIQDAIKPSRPGNFDVTLTAAKNVDSIYRGAYSNSASAPAFRIAGNPSLPPTSDLSITVDKEGKFLGTLSGYRITGTVTSDGRITASIFNDVDAFPMSGKISKQGVPTIDPKTGDTVFKPGVAGNIVVTVSGTTYPGFIQVAGGFTSN